VNGDMVNILRIRAAAGSHLQEPARDADRDLPPARAGIRTISISSAGGGGPSGKRLDAYRLHDHFVPPLGLTYTGFRLGESQRNGWVGMHARGRTDR